MLVVFNVQEPPNLAWFTMLRVRRCVPVPHLLEQASKLVHGDKPLQSIGQAKVLQRQRLSMGGQAIPPYAAAVITLRVRVFEPPSPQLFEQALHVLQAVTMQ
jgi:hypothetical protein